MSRRNFRGNGGAIIIARSIHEDELVIEVGRIEAAQAWLGGRYDIEWTEKELPGSHVIYEGKQAGSKWPENIAMFIISTTSFSLGDEWFDRIEKL